jgi:hypothetical protein
MKAQLKIHGFPTVDPKIIVVLPAFIGGSNKVISGEIFGWSKSFHNNPLLLLGINCQESHVQSEADLHGAIKSRLEMIDEINDLLFSTNFNQGSIALLIIIPRKFKEAFKVL